MTNIEILDNLELDIDDFFKKKHINAYNIDSWTDKKSERTFNYTYEIKSNKKIDSGALYDYLFSESDILLHNLDMGVKIIPLENTDYYTQFNIIISVPNELAESKKSMKESINGDCYIYFDDNGEIYGKKRRWVFCDNVKGITDTRDFFPLNDFIIDAIHIFKNEKQAQKFIDVDCKYFEDKNKLVIAEYPQTVSGFFESKKSLKESYPNYDVDDVYKELKRLCDKGKNVFSEFYVERDENAFVVSISDDSSYIKLKDFIPYNIHYNENSFYMHYDNDSTYMTIFANYEDENAINVLVEVVRSLANLKGAYDKCETVSTEIVNQVSNLY